MLMTLRISENGNPIIFHLYANVPVPEINPGTPRQFSSPGILSARTTRCSLVTNLRSAGPPGFKNNHPPQSHNGALFTLITGG